MALVAQGTKSSLTDLTLPRSRQLEERARRVGLDPTESTLLKICCAEQGLDPKVCTCLDLAAVRLGKSPGELSEEDVRTLLGDHWVSRILE